MKVRVRNGKQLAHRERSALAGLLVHLQVGLEPFGELQGKDALAGQWDGLWSTLETLAFFAVVGAIEVAGDTARTRGYVRELAVMKEGPAQKIAGRYDDDLVREDGMWKFASRRYTVLIREADD